MTQDLELSGSAYQLVSHFSASQNRFIHISPLNCILADDSKYFVGRCLFFLGFAPVWFQFQTHLYTLAFLDVLLSLGDIAAAESAADAALAAAGAVGERSSIPSPHVTHHVTHHALPTAISFTHDVFRHEVAQSRNCIGG